MKIRAILFDLDDTLHDKSATLRRVAAAQFQQAELALIGIDKTIWESVFIELNNLRIEKTEVFNRLRDRFGLTSVTEKILLHDFDTNLGKFAVPYEGAIALLKACKEHGLKIGIVTNGRDAFQRSKIAGMGITSLIDVIVTSGEFGTKKPNPEIFQACLQELDVSAPEAIFIGDDFVADMAPAIALGMSAIWKSASTSNAIIFSSNSLPDIQDFLFQDARLQFTRNQDPSSA